MRNVPRFQRSRAPSQITSSMHAIHFLLHSFDIHSSAAVDLSIPIHPNEMKTNLTYVFSSAIYTNGQVVTNHFCDGRIVPSSLLEDEGTGSWTSSRTAIWNRFFFLRYTLHEMDSSLFLLRFLSCQPSVDSLSMHPEWSMRSWSSP